MASIQTQLLNWYDKNARELPWRSDPSPYKVWISEIMLQQTRVESVLPYYKRFLKRFPDLSGLASAEPEEVLRLWEGLGYYSRARNLHKAAQELVKHHDGVLPDNARELQKLPGIGKYTAAAIASIAFGEPVAAVDGNIRRIYARLLALDEPLGSSAFDKTINCYAQDLIPQDRPGDYTQALMDLGSTICLPQNPNCHACPISNNCKAFEQGRQNQLPLIPAKTPVPHYEVCVAVLHWNGKVLLSQRKVQGLLAGLWEFPGGKREMTDQCLEDCLVRELKIKTGYELPDVNKHDKMGVFRHAYTHYKISVHAWQIVLSNEPTQDFPANLRWVDLANLPNYPMGKVARLIANKLTENTLFQ